MFLGWIVTVSLIQGIRTGYPVDGPLKESKTSFNGPESYFYSESKSGRPEYFPIDSHDEKHEIYEVETIQRNQNLSGCHCVINFCSCCTYTSREEQSTKRVCVLLSNLKKGASAQTMVVDHYKTDRQVLYSGHIEEYNNTDFAFDAKTPPLNALTTYSIEFPHLDFDTDKNELIGCIKISITSELHEKTLKRRIGCFHLIGKESNRSLDISKQRCHCIDVECLCCAHINDSSLLQNEIICYKICDLQKDFSFMVEIKDQSEKRPFLKKRLLGGQDFKECYEIDTNDVLYDYCFEISNGVLKNKPYSEVEGNLRIQTRIGKTPFIQRDFGAFKIRSAKRMPKSQLEFNKYMDKFEKGCVCKKFQCSCCFFIWSAMGMKTKYCLIMNSLNEESSFTIIIVKTAKHNSNTLLLKRAKGNKPTAFCQTDASVINQMLNKYQYCLDFYKMETTASPLKLSGCAIITIAQNIFRKQFDFNICFVLDGKPREVIVPNPIGNFLWEKVTTTPPTTTISTTRATTQSTEVPTKCSRTTLHPTSKSISEQANNTFDGLVLVGLARNTKCTKTTSESITEPDKIKSTKCSKTTPKFSTEPADIKSSKYISEPDKIKSTKCTKTTPKQITDITLPTLESNLNEPSSAIPIITIESPSEKSAPESTSESISEKTAPESISESISEKTGPPSEFTSEKSESTKATTEENPESTLTSNAESEKSTNFTLEKLESLPESELETGNNTESALLTPEKNAESNSMKPEPTKESTPEFNITTGFTSAEFSDSKDISETSPNMEDDTNLNLNDSSLETFPTTEDMFMETFPTFEGEVTPPEGSPTFGDAETITDDGTEPPLVTASLCKKEDCPTESPLEISEHGFCQNATEKASCCSEIKFFWNTKRKVCIFIHDLDKDKNFTLGIGEYLENEKKPVSFLKETKHSGHMPFKQCFVSNSYLSEIKYCVDFSHLEIKNDTLTGCVGVNGQLQIADPIYDTMGCFEIKDPKYWENNPSGE